MKHFLMTLLEQRDSEGRYMASVITVQKHNYITSVTDFGESGSYFIEKIIFGFAPDVHHLLCLTSQ